MSKTFDDQLKELQTPAPPIGHNKPPIAKQISETENFAAEVADFLRDQFAEMPKTVAELLAEAAKIPEKVEDATTRDEAARLVKRMRDTYARIEASRVKEKEPYLRGEQAVDAFFFGVRDKLGRRDKKANPGAGDVLSAKIDDFTQRLLAAEQAERNRLATIAAREAREAVERMEKARWEAEERRRAAERARSPEKIEEKREAADQQEAVASQTTAAAGVADQRAEDAYVHSLAKPADMVRARVEEGPTVTMAKESYAIVEDEAKLDKEALWPFVALDAKEKALRAWAKTTGHAREMAGAKIGHRQKTVVR